VCELSKVLAAFVLHRIVECMEDMMRDLAYLKFGVSVNCITINNVLEECAMSNMVILLPAKCSICKGYLSVAIAHSNFFSE